MSSKPDLAEAIEQIIDKVEEELNTAVGSSLSEVKTVARGEAVRPKPMPPIMWIYTDTARVSPDSTTLREVWEMPIMLVAVVQDSQDPKRGQALATKLAAKARTVIINDRKLGLSFVNYVESTAFEPRTRFPAEGGKYSAGTAISVTFTIFE